MNVFLKKAGPEGSDRKNLKDRHNEAAHKVKWIVIVDEKKFPISETKLTLLLLTANLTGYYSGWLIIKGQL